MTFYTYMLREHRGQGGPLGDLADDMYRDKERFPRNKGRNYAADRVIIRRYLEMNGACPECKNVFEDAWQEYVARENNRHGGKSRPAATHGAWVEKNDETDPDFYLPLFTCSVCGSEVDDDTFDFCPYCASIMDEEA